MWAAVCREDPVARVQSLDSWIDCILSQLFLQMDVGEAHRLRFAINRIVFSFIAIKAGSVVDDEKERVVLSYVSSFVRRSTWKGYGN